MIKFNYFELNFNFIFFEVFRRVKYDNEFVFEKKSKMVKKKLFFISYFCIDIVIGCIFISNIMS